MSEMDYKNLLASYHKLEKENRKLKKILSLENVSALEILVKECMKYNRDQIRKVAIELQLTNYDSKNIEEIIRLVKFFKTMCEELNTMTEVSESECRCTGFL